MDLPSLGIDGGATGAAVMVLNGDVIAAAEWRALYKKGEPRKLRARMYLHGVRTETAKHPGPSQIGDELRRFFMTVSPEGWHLGVEDAFFHHNKAKAGATIKNIRFTGALMGHLELNAVDGVAKIVHPTTWRKTILGVKTGMRGGPKRDVLKKLSLSIMPQRLPGLLHVLEVLGQYDHLTDAAAIAECVARYGNTLKS